MWVDTEDFLHQELTSDGRYDETRGGRPHALQGRYRVDGSPARFASGTASSSESTSMRYAPRCMSRSPRSTSDSRPQEHGDETVQRPS
ncbi:Atu4866 domain-containing protein [Nonomuraea sp. NPDC046802]|uniref:Atu4866 domain-containing protein n=1 Tax=Nonomuraea sp. NPDC046802 TaxID=3154919 RepID=UPI0033C114D7